MMGTSHSTKKSVDDLKLHVSDDGVWYGVGSDIQKSELTPEQFARTPLVKNAGRLWFLGTHANAPLISAVYVARKKDIPSKRVMIASPRVGLRKGGEPARVIFSRMSMTTWPSSVGGWRQVASHDFVIYALIAELQRTGGVITKSAELFLKQHPAWPAISFIYRHQTQPACRLLSEITDPRWHMDVDEPERYAQLRNYLGFGSTIQIATGKISTALNLLRGYDGACPPCDDVRLYRTMLTVASWYGGFVEDPKLTKELSKHLREPTAFLLRYLYDPKEEERHDVRFVRANHRFIRFVKMVWLDNLYPHRCYRKVTQNLGRNHPERVSRHKMLCPKAYERTLFVPEHFFGEMDEVEAWKRHTAKLRRANR